MSTKYGNGGRERDMRTWHIIGSDGYIGSRLIKAMPKDQPFICYSPIDTQQAVYFDLTSERSFDLSRIHEGDFVVFLAAISSPDLCEKQYDMAYAINVTGTRKLIERCVEKKGNVLFFSSDVVNGATGMEPVDENYIGKPVGKYGQMKRIIEETFSSCKHFKAFRLSYVFSREDKFTGYLHRCDEQNATADVFNALYRNVIYRADIFEAIWKLSQTFEQWDNAIFNLSGPDTLSRMDLAAIYKRVISPQFSYSISHPLDAFFEARPNIISTRSLYLEELLGRSPTRIENAIKIEFGLL